MRLAVRDGWLFSYIGVVLHRKCFGEDGAVSSSLSPLFSFWNLLVIQGGKRGFIFASEMKEKCYPHLQIQIG